MATMIQESMDSEYDDVRFPQERTQGLILGLTLEQVIVVLAGVLIGPLLGGQISIGVALTVKGFMAAILGGLGSPFAAAAGGVAIGVAEAMIAGYGNSLYAEPIIFLIILMVLFVRPYGLLGDFEAARR